MNAPVQNFKSARLTKHGNVVLPKCRMVYPAYFKAVVPKGEKDQSKAKFGGVYLIPKGCDLKALTEAIGNAAKEKFGRTKGVKGPVKRTEESKSLSKFSDDYPYYVRAQSNYQPQVVAPDGRTFVTDEQVAYSGRWCVVSVTPFAWNHPTGGDGVSLSINSVQLLDHAEKIGGASAPVEDEFIPASIDGEDGGGDFGGGDDDEDDFLR